MFWGLKLFIPITSKSNKPTINLKGKTILVDIADNESLRKTGLSGRKDLNDNEGMLFVYETKTVPIFWMKDMLFPIDIIWIEDNYVVNISKNAPAPAPGTSDASLPRYAPLKPINYVLEVTAGFSDKNNIEPGDQFDFAI